MPKANMYFTYVYIVQLTERREKRTLLVKVAVLAVVGDKVAVVVEDAPRGALPSRRAFSFFVIE